MGGCLVIFVRYICRAKNKSKIFDGIKVNLLHACMAWGGVWCTSKHLEGYWLKYDNWEFYMWLHVWSPNLDIRWILWSRFWGHCPNPLEHVFCIFFIFWSSLSHRPIKCGCFFLSKRDQITHAYLILKWYKKDNTNPTLYFIISYSSFK